MKSLGRKYSVVEGYDMNPMKSLWYQSPAAYWEAALPLGNGRLGAMFAGGVSSDSLELNEDTLWSGRPGGAPNDSAYYGNLLQARRLLAERKFSEAEKFISANMLSRDCETYLTAGKLLLNFPETPEPEHYRRSLDLEDALARVSFDSGAMRVEREGFASFPDQVIALACRSSQRNSLHLSLRLDSPQEHVSGTAGNDLFLNGACPAHDRYGKIVQTDEQGRSGIHFQMRVRVIAEGGAVSRAEDGGLWISAASSVVLLIAIRSDFIDWKTEPGKGGVDPESACLADLDRAASFGYETLKKRHLDDYRPLFARSILELETRPGDELPTDERLKNLTDDFSPSIAALLYHYGRYLLLASSRPGSQPANLQGIWNRSMMPPWACNYTVNINLEMNYWHAETASLEACAEPLTRGIREFAESGAATARELYHARGWCLHHNSDLWRFSLPASGRPQWGYWPVGGLWLCRHLYEHYDFSRDPEFLRTHYDILRDAAAFALDLLTPNEKGELVTSPASSPENRFHDPLTGEPVGVCGNGSTMDLLLIREVFRHLLSAAAILKKEEPLLAEIRAALPKIRPITTGADGRLLEYSEDFEEDDVHHRHLSHLYGVYPGDEFTRTQHPELYRASRLSLERRGDQSTGWAMGWRVVLWARFRDGERACRVLRNLLTFVEPIDIPAYRNKGGVYANLFDAHPPFQIDGNFGAAAGIVEMLVQSHEKDDSGRVVVDLLPALPPTWNRGRVSGLRCRGGLTLAFAWETGRLSHLRIQASFPAEIVLACGSVRKIVKLSSGENVVETESY